MLYTSKAIISSGRVAMSLIRNNEVTNLRGASTHTHRHLSLATWGIFIPQRVVMILVPHTHSQLGHRCASIFGVKRNQHFRYDYNTLGAPRDFRAICVLFVWHCR